MVSLLNDVLFKNMLRTIVCIFSNILTYILFSIGNRAYAYSGLVSVCVTPMLMSSTR